VARGTSGPDLRVIQADDLVQIIGHLDRRSAEALALEVRAIARRYGLEVCRAEVPPDEVPGIEASGGNPDSTQ
jgi:hypothetical protein